MNRMNRLLYTLRLVTALFLISLTSMAPAQQTQNQQDTALADKKWKLWSEGTKLRGANIWQRKIVPDLDYDFLGDGYIGPPYTQTDFDRLSALGANYINLSIPGIYSERPPYVLDSKALSNLDDLIEKAKRADLFIVITFRTGPGRSDFTFYRDGAGEWFSEALLIETVWQSKEAQAAWADMWRFTAERYKNLSHVVAYDLMCEPNAEDILFGIYDPAAYYPQYANAVHDWNHFYPNLIKAIRSTDSGTPILVSCSGWGNPSWLPYLKPVEDRHLVYSFHQYEPHGYTHQEPSAKISYPGKFDIDEDGKAESFNKVWLSGLFGSIAQAQAAFHLPLSCNEYGIRRFVPGADKFIADELEFMEKLGINHAVWMWYPDWKEWKDNAEMNDFNFRMTAAATQTREMDNPLLSVLKKFWSRNSVRPSSW